MTNIKIEPAIPYGKTIADSTGWKLNVYGDVSVTVTLSHADGLQLYKSLAEGLAAFNLETTRISQEAAGALATVSESLLPKT